MTVRCWSELNNLPSFEERFHYLRLDSGVGQITFGFDRHVNQAFYRSQEWKRAREYVIVRDEGCDLGIPGRELHVGLLIHHMNPIRIEDITRRNVDILNPEYLVVVSHRTHNAIHYGVESLAPPVVMQRQPNDTKLW